MHVPSAASGSAAGRGSSRQRGSAINADIMDDLDDKVG